MNHNTKFTRGNVKYWRYSTSSSECCARANGKACWQWRCAWGSEIGIMQWSSTSETERLTTYSWWYTLWNYTCWGQSTEENNEGLLMTVNWKKTTRTVDNKTFSSARNDDGKRKEDRYLYPANNYNLINLSPCGRSTGAIPKRHTTPKRRRIPRRRNHHQQNNHVMSKSKWFNTKKVTLLMLNKVIIVWRSRTKPGSNHPTTKTPFLGLGRASTGRPWRVCNNQ